MHKSLLVAISCILLSSVIVLGNSTACAQTSASSFTTGYRYDLQRRLTGTINPDPDGSGSINFAAIRNTYDSAGRLIKVEKGELAAWQSQAVAPSAWTGFTVFQQVDTIYDGMDRKIREIVTSGGTRFSITDYTYDNVGRLECTAVRMNKALFASPPATSTTCGAWTVGSDGPDRITKNVYDAAGELVQVRKGVGTSLEQATVTYGWLNPATNQIEPRYTPNGKKEYVVDANGNKAKLEYDGFDRQSKWIFPSKTRPTAFNPGTVATALSTSGAINTADYEQYGYDANSNRTSLRKRSGQSIGYSYDALNRMTVKDIPGGTAADVYYGYDLRGLQLYARFVSTSGQGITSVYDNAGRQTSSANNVGGTSRTLSYQYDADGNRTRLTYPDSNYVTFDYDGLDRMTLVKEGGTTTVATIAYNNKGERSGLTGGVATSYGYDAISRFASVAHNLAGTANDVTYCMGTMSGSTCTPVYNAASQVMARTISNDAFAVSGQFNANRGYVTNGLNQYTTAGATSPTHDVNGNLTFADGTTYAYDVENRLTSASGSTAATLTYDPLGRLGTTVSAGSTTRFLYDGDELVGEYDGSGALTQRYVHGPNIDEPILWYEGSAFTSTTRRILRADHQGSIVSVADSSGASVGINSYDERGNPGLSNMGRFAYTGQIYLPELKLYHYKARIYNPRLGRFNQTDPVGYEDQFNLYAYVANDPLNKVDPAGQRIILVGTPAERREARAAIRAVATSDKRLLQRYNSLRDSSNVHTVRITSADKPLSQSQNVIPVKASDGQGTSTNVTINRNQTTLSDGTPNNVNSTVAHELFGHSYEADKGVQDRTVDPTTGVRNLEVNATQTENIYREKSGMPVREQYRGPYGDRPVPKIEDDKLR